MKKIGFIGNPMRLQAGARDNTGNIVHGHAARSLFADPINVKSEPSEENLEAVRGSITHLGFVAATMLHVRKPPKYVVNHERAAEFVEKLDLPVCAFGFGCHAGLDDTVAQANVDPRSLRLLRAIADRSETVGVRGEFTADLCMKYGVKNVSVVGCQSAYIAATMNSEGLAGVDPSKPAMATISLGPDESRVLELIIRIDGDIIGQNDPTEERIASGELSRENFLMAGKEVWLAPFVNSMISSGRLSRETYFDYIKTRFKKFYSVPEWRSHIKQNYGFCFGTRFHGNMISLQAGVPALWLVHDMRTNELCRHLKLPSAPIGCVESSTTVDSLHERCDYGEFWKHIPQRTEEFVDYLAGNGVADLMNEKIGKALNRVISGSEPQPRERCNAGSV